MLYDNAKAFISNREACMAATKSPPKAEVFSLKTPYLSAGRTTEFVARTDLMSVAIKVYSEGGENALHTHLHEDHAFIVLEGEATFADRAGNETVVGKYQGISLPRGAFYWFKSTGDTNLVLLRVGANDTSWQGDTRVAPDGHSIPSRSEENKRIDGVPIPGKFFGD
jgi:mannose-6-phosphate isomerase-like protein (cupin superfamily)